MSMKHYLAARKEGLKQQHAAQARGQDPYLPVLSELVPTLNKLTQVPLGLVQIALDQIEGTATKGRTTAFSRGFMPLLEQDSEFASKWSVLYDGIVEDGLRQPIVALEYYNRFYIVEGNKRVSVMCRLDAVSIEADVTRVLPEPEDSERYRVYQEFLSFYADTKINFITFTREGSYEKLYKLMGKTPGKKWSPEDLFDFQSCFYRFQQAYNAKAEGNAPMPACDALLIYLEVFGYEERPPSSGRRSSGSGLNLSSPRPTSPPRCSPSRRKPSRASCNPSGTSRRRRCAARSSTTARRRIPAGRIGTSWGARRLRIPSVPAWKPSAANTSRRRTRRRSSSASSRTVTT